MILTGRVFDVIIISDKVAQIVLRKKLGDAVVPVAVTIFGYYKDKAINELKIKPKDKIKGNLYLKSKLYNGRYLTDVFFKELIVVESYNPSVITDPTQQKMFVDEETGEVFEDDEDIDF